MPLPHLGADVAHHAQDQLVPLVQPPLYESLQDSSQAAQRLIAEPATTAFRPRSAAWLKAFASCAMTPWQDTLAHLPFKADFQGTTSCG
jgi:hypothetical protein